MKAALIQRQLKLNCDVLTGLHEEYNALKESRKMYNERADACFMQMIVADEQLDFDASHQHNSEGDANRERAAVFTSYIKKYREKIAKLEEVQRALKVELRAEQKIEMWQAQEDAEWKQLAQLAQQEDYKVTYSWDELAEMFSDDE